MSAAQGDLVGNNKSICILRLSAIGDVCHTVAMVRRIQNQRPDLKITWIVGQTESTLIEGLENVELIVFNKSDGLAAFAELRRKLQGRQFNILLQMQSALRASMVSLFIPAKVKIGFDRQRAKEAQWLFTHCRIEPQQSPHVLEGFLGFASKLDTLLETHSSSIPQPSNENSLVWDIPLSPSIEAWAKKQINGKPTAIISPAASKSERNWLANRYALIADYLHTCGFQVLLCGGTSQAEHNLAEAIRLHSTATIKLLVGQTNLKQLLALLKHSQVLLSPDSGPVHMAVAVQTPTIGLYAHSNPKRTGPYLYQRYVVDHYTSSILEQYGRSPDQLPWGTRAKGKLMHKITVNSVKEKIDLLIRDHYPDMLN